MKKWLFFLSICLYLSPIYAADRFTIAKEKIVNEFMECMSNKDMGNGVVSFCYGKAADTLEALGDMYVIDRQTQKIDEDEISIIKEDVLFFKYALKACNTYAEYSSNSQHKIVEFSAICRFNRAYEYANHFFELNEHEIAELGDDLNWEVELKRKFQRQLNLPF